MTFSKHLYILQVLRLRESFISEGIYPVVKIRHNSEVFQSNPAISQGSDIFKWACEFPLHLSACECESIPSSDMTKIYTSLTGLSDPDILNDPMNDIISSNLPTNHSLYSNPEQFVTIDITVDSSDTSPTLGTAYIGVHDSLGLQWLPIFQNDICKGHILVAIHRSTPAPTLSVPLAIEKKFFMSQADKNLVKQNLADRELIETLTTAVISGDSARIYAARRDSSSITSLIECLRDEGMRALFVSSMDKVVSPHYLPAPGIQLLVDILNAALTQAASKHDFSVCQALLNISAKYMVRIPINKTLTQYVAYLDNKNDLQKSHYISGTTPTNSSKDSQSTHPDAESDHEWVSSPTRTDSAFTYLKLHNVFGSFPYWEHVFMDVCNRARKDPSLMYRVLDSDSRSNSLSSRSSVSKKSKKPSSQPQFVVDKTQNVSSDGVVQPQKLTVLSPKSDDVVSSHPCVQDCSHYQSYLAFRTHAKSSNVTSSELSTTSSLYPDHTHEMYFSHFPTPSSTHFAKYRVMLHTRELIFLHSPSTIPVENRVIIMLIESMLVGLFIIGYDVDAVGSFMTKLISVCRIPDSILSYIHNIWDTILIQIYKYFPDLADATVVCVRDAWFECVSPSDTHYYYNEKDGLVLYVPPPDWESLPISSCRTSDLPYRSSESQTSHNYLASHLPLTPTPSYYNSSSRVPPPSLVASNSASHSRPHSNANHPHMSSIATEALSPSVPSYSPVPPVRVPPPIQPKIPSKATPISPPLLSGMGIGDEDESGVVDYDSDVDGQVKHVPDSQRMVLDHGDDDDYEGDDLSSDDELVDDELVESHHDLQTLESNPSALMSPLHTQMIDNTSVFRTDSQHSTYSHSSLSLMGTGTSTPVVAMMDDPFYPSTPGGYPYSPGIDVGSNMSGSGFVEGRGRSVAVARGSGVGMGIGVGGVKVNTSSCRTNWGNCGESLRSRARTVMRDHTQPELPSETRDPFLNVPLATPPPSNSLNLPTSHPSQVSSVVPPHSTSLTNHYLGVVGAVNSLNNPISLARAMSGHYEKGEVEVAKLDDVSCLDIPSCVFGLDFYYDIMAQLANAVESGEESPSYAGKLPVADSISALKMLCDQLQKPVISGSLVLTNYRLHFTPRIIAHSNYNSSTHIASPSVSSVGDNPDSSPSPRPPNSPRSPNHTPIVSQIHNVFGSIPLASIHRLEVVNAVDSKPKYASVQPIGTAGSLINTQIFHQAFAFSNILSTTTHPHDSTGKTNSGSVTDSHDKSLDLHREQQEEQKTGVSNIPTYHVKVPVKNPSQFYTPILPGPSAPPVPTPPNTYSQSNTSTSTSITSTYPSIDSVAVPNSKSSTIFPYPVTQYAFTAGETLCHIRCKDLRQISFSILPRQNDSINNSNPSKKWKNFTDTMKQYMYPTFSAQSKQIANSNQSHLIAIASSLKVVNSKAVNQLMAFAYTLGNSVVSEDGWLLYKIDREFHRQGALDSGKWQLSFINQRYEFSPTYPAVLAVPTPPSSLTGISTSVSKTTNGSTVVSPPTLSPMSQMGALATQLASSNALLHTTLTKSKQYRSKGRLPVLSYYHRHSGSAILRSSQPLPGLTRARSTYDEDICKWANVHYIIDARPKANAQANALKGGGFEHRTDENYNSTLVFCDIENIHVMRSSLKKITSLCRDLCPHALSLSLTQASYTHAELMAREMSKTIGNITMSMKTLKSSELIEKNISVDLSYLTHDIQSGYNHTIDYHQEIHNSQWLKHVQLTLHAAIQIASVVHTGSSVLVHCSDGWDRTSQLCMLSELLLDPYYRTIEGFIVLIEKDFCSFGHKFADRSGHLDKNYHSSERSPIFIQALDCVYQIMTQYPQAFEFTTSLLDYILSHLYSCKFGTFLFNNERERDAAKVRQYTSSLWTSVLKTGIYHNHCYKPLNGLIWPNADIRKLELWPFYYRWDMNHLAFNNGK